MTIEKRTVAEMVVLYREHQDRLLGLMAEHGIDQDRPDRWGLLAAVLANQQQLLTHEWDDASQSWIDPNKGDGGRPTKWPQARKEALVQAIEAYMVGERTAADAAYLLHKKGEPWGDYKVDTLEARYSDFKKEAAEQAKADAFGKDLSEVFIELDNDRLLKQRP